jgi:hypothetical protein
MIEVIDKKKQKSKFDHLNVTNIVGIVMPHRGHASKMLLFRGQK